VASGLVAKAKAKDSYDQRTQAKIKAREEEEAARKKAEALQRLELEAKKAQAASSAAAELLKPGGQVLLMQAHPFGVAACRKGVHVLKWRHACKRKGDVHATSRCTLVRCLQKGCSRLTSCC